MLLRKLQMHYENKNTAITRQSKNFIASHQSQIKQFIHLVALQFTGSSVYKELVKLYKEVYERDIFHSSLGASKENCKKLKYAAEIYRITKL